MLDLNRIETVATIVHNAFKAFLTGAGPKDTFVLVAAAGSAVLTKGGDISADLSALEALDKFNSDAMAAIATAKAQAAQQP